MLGETAGLKTLDQLFHTVSAKLELFLMATLTTLRTSRTPSRRHILRLKRRDKIPLMLKKLQILGDMDGPQALAQSF